MTKKQRKRYGKLLGVILLMGLLKMLSGCCAHKTAMDGTETGVRHNNEMPYPCEIIEPLCALFERLADEAASLS